MRRPLIAVVPAAHAKGLYLGGSVGSGSADFGQTGTTRINFDAVGYKLFAGYGAMRFLAFGFGIAYNITPKLGLQLEWEN